MDTLRPDLKSRRLPGGHRQPRIAVAALLALVVAATLSLTRTSRAQGSETAAASNQRTVAITGDRISGFVIPIEPLTGDITLSALTGWAWTVDDTKRLLLEGDVRISIGGNTTHAEAASVWLNRIPSSDGLINQLVVYYDDARNPSRQAGLGAEGRDLLVTASARGDVRLSVARLHDSRPRLVSVIQNGELRLARYLKQLIAIPPGLRQQPAFDTPPPPRQGTLVPGGHPVPVEPELPSVIDLPSLEPTTVPLLAPKGIVRWSAGAIELSRGAEEDVITASGSLIIEYVATVREGDWSQLTLSAERGVIFKRSDAQSDAVQVDAADIHGIYLEGNVQVSANDGEYVARAPRVYYDFTQQRAIMLDAVLRTYARQSSIPIYARAEELRQVAANQWQAEQVRVSTSEFFKPHLAIGARRMTLTRRPVRADPNNRETYLTSEDNTLLAGDLPLIGWPKFSGTVRDVPLRRATIGTRENDGVRLQTRWDLHALSGKDAPTGTRADLLVDVFTKRGGAVGLDYKYNDGETRGHLDLYLMYDQGTDRLTTGREIEQDGGLRGVALFEHDARLSRDWTFQTQVSAISDETFIAAWREDDFIRRREYETSAYLKQQHGTGAMTLLAQYSLNDFISNDYLLASRQYSVDKLPEITFRRYGADAFDESMTYSGETRLTRMRVATENHTPTELGLAGSALGIGDNDNPRDVLRQRGIPSHYVARFDSRHEFAMPRTVGVFKVVPFLVGRFTAYDEDFEEFSSESDSTRAFGAIGVRVNTQIQHVDNSVRNEVLDLNRIRHIIEPSATVWWSTANVSDEDLPEYDAEVESLATGAAVRLGVRNTWQTQRGGPGRWRSVDYLTVDSNVVYHSNDTNREAPSPRFFDYRPEYSQFGDHIYTSAVWLLSDTVSLVGENTWDLDNSIAARSSVGAEIQHSPILSTFVEYRFLHASNNELLDVGWDYRLTPVYRVNFNPQWDFEVNDVRALTLRVTRTFPDFDFAVQVRRDEIADDTTIGASIDLAKF